MKSDSFLSARLEKWYQRLMVSSLLPCLLSQAGEKELLPHGLCSLAVACSTLHNQVHFLYGKQSSDCLLCPTLWLFFVIITVLSNETVHWTEKLWACCSSPPATWWIHSFCFFPFCHLPAWDGWLLADHWARSLCLSPKWWLVLPPPRT